MDGVGEAKCDFCGAAGPTWRFPCKTFRRDEEILVGDEVAVLDHGYVGDWIACERCKITYEEGGLDGLTDRVVRRYVTRDSRLANPSVQDRLKAECRRLYAQFQMHREGEPVAYEREREGG
jgi:hypothetical protein